MKTTAICVSFCVLLTALAFAETIYLKDGKVIHGRIIEQRSDSIKVDISGIPITYDRDKIKRIEGETSRVPSVLTNSPSLISEKTPAQIFQEVSPSVVVIVANSPQGRSQGSGFVVDSDGVIATNFHVVGGADDIEVKFRDGRSYPVTEIIDYDVIRDICILKIEAYGLTTASLGNSNYLQPGSKVLVIGAPLGLEYSITEGLYSGKRKFSDQNSLQFSAPISPGNSGGPLLDLSGKVVGITTFIKPEGQNVNFAIPINDAKRFFGVIPKMTITEFATKLSKAYSYYKMAEERFYSNNLKGAISYAEKAARVDPSFIDGHIYLATLYSTSGRLNEAVAQLKKGLEVDPKDMELHNELGIVYFKQGRVKLAIKEFNKAIVIAPEEAMLYSNLAAAYEKTNKVDKAIELLNKAIALDPGYPMAHKNLGWGYYRKKRFEQAIQETKKAISLDPYDAQAYLNLSWIYFDYGQPEMAVRYCDQAVNLGQQIDPNFLAKLRPYRKQTSESVVQGDSHPIYTQVVFSPEEADRIYARLDTESARLMSRAGEAGNQNEFNLEIQYLEKLKNRLRKGSEEYYYTLERIITAHLLIGLDYARKGYYDAAIDPTKQALDILDPLPKRFDVRRVQCYYTLAQIYTEQGDKLMAGKYMDKIRLISIDTASSLEKQLSERYNY